MIGPFTPRWREALSIPIESYCASCGQEFTRASHFTYVRGQRVCRDNEACIEQACITEGDRRLIAFEAARRDELRRFRHLVGDRERAS